MLQKRPKVVTEESKRKSFRHVVDVKKDLSHALPCLWAALSGLVRSIEQNKPPLLSCRQEDERWKVPVLTKERHSGKGAVSWPSVQARLNAGISLPVISTSPLGQEFPKLHLQPRCLSEVW